MRVMQQMGLRINGLEERQMCIITVNDFLKVFKEDESAAPPAQSPTAPAPADPPAAHPSPCE